MHQPDRAAHLGPYVNSFASSQQDAPARGGHLIRWRPKFADPAPFGDVPGLTDPAALISALRARGGGLVALRVAEFTHEAVAEATAFAD